MEKFVRRCKKCNRILRIPEDYPPPDGLCGDCVIMDLGIAKGGKIREYFRPPRGDPGRKEAPPGG